MLLSGIVLLSQSQSQPHVVAPVTGETPAPTEVGKDIREQDLHVRSIEVIIHSGITIEVDHALANRSTRLSRTTRNAVYQTR